MPNQKEAPDWKDNATVCIGGKTITLKEFLAGEKEKEVKSEVEIDSRQIEKTIKRSLKKKVLKTKGTNDDFCAVVSTKIYSEEEVKQMAKEMESKMARSILAFYVANQGKFCTVKDLHNSISGFAYGSITALNSRIYKALSRSKMPPMMERMKNPDRPGFTYKLINEDCSADELTEMFSDLNKSLLRIENKERKERKAKGKEFKPITIEDETEEDALRTMEKAGVEMETKDLQSAFIPLSSETTKKVDLKSQLEPEKNPTKTELTPPASEPIIPSQIKIDITMKVLFGFIKE